jgi:hypothetical protein
LEIITPILVLVTIIAVIVVLFWIPSEILHKAGFSRWLALLIPPTGFLGLAVFAWIEWPIEREVAWLRFKDGKSSEDLVAKVEAYAVDLEKRGDWSSAAAVYEELGRRVSSAESAEYYQNCVERLNQLRGKSPAG